MKSALLTLPCLALVCALSGCDERGGVSAEGCGTTMSIAFAGREYTSVEWLDGVRADEVDVGQRLGVGEAPSACGTGPGEQVQVFRVVGVPPSRAVFARPTYGLMARSDLDGPEQAGHARVLAR